MEIPIHGRITLPDIGKMPPRKRQIGVTNALRLKYLDNPQNQRDEAMRPCAFAAQTLMFTAKQMGLDSCPMRGFEYDDLAKIINLPEDHILVMMVVVGKAMELPDPRGGQLDLNEVVFENNFP